MMKNDSLSHSINEQTKVRDGAGRENINDLITYCFYSVL